MSTRNAETYAICSIDDLPKVDFTQVLETDELTVRRSLDFLQFVIKWDVEPTFIEDGQIVPIQTLTHLEAINLMGTEEWEIPYPEPETEISE